jgi:hypothetical protein
MLRAILVFFASAFASILSAQTATLRPEAQPPEHVKLRAEAVGLLERANRVSTPAVWGSREMRLRFRVPGPAPGEALDGEYLSSVGGPGLRRQEWHYGDYQLSEVRNGQRLNLTGSKRPFPAILQLLPKLTPIYLVHFDERDIIRSITAGAGDSRCIQFDTTFGDRQQSNEICVDTGHGWLLSTRVGDETTRNSRFFAFHEVFLPAHIEHWRGDAELIEIDETVSDRNNYPPDFFSVPETSTGFVCQEFREAYPKNTPQPPPQASAEVHDVTLRGLIGFDGYVTGLTAVDQARPDLNEEAIKLVSTWTYTPASCGGKPAMWWTLFTVHFKGR